MQQRRLETNFRRNGRCGARCLALFALGGLLLPASPGLCAPLEKRVMTEEKSVPQEPHVEKGVNHAATGKQAHLTAVTDPRKLGYTLTFHDEFNGSHLDTHKWIDSYPGNVRTHSNNEQQYYATDGYTVADGHLRLTALPRTMGSMPYTSGMITSFGKFAQKYGWFEIRTRLPHGKGMWPAFWLLPNDESWPPEIDILEVLGHEPDKVYLTNHYVNAHGQHEGKGDSYKGPDFSAGYHTFAVEWKPDSIVWYVDGVPRYHTEENIPHVPMYVLANLAVGGDWPGNPDATTPFPGTMDIDYIRVYSPPTP